ncbi:MAG: ferredoxin family protein [Methanomassiliicoccales archaeon]|nr:ferredoxin family protein [Methanomassiliicoccales archaeon]
MEVRVNPEYCKGCRLCVTVCPRKVIEEGTELSEKGYVPPMVAHPEKCANWKRTDKRKAVCEMCILTCPDHALELDEKARTQPEAVEE